MYIYLFFIEIPFVLIAFAILAFLAIPVGHLLIILGALTCLLGLFTLGYLSYKDIPYDAPQQKAAFYLLAIPGMCMFIAGVSNPGLTMLKLFM